LGDRQHPNAKSIVATLERRRASGGFLRFAGRTLDKRERSICKLITSRISEILRHQSGIAGKESLLAIQDAFDGYIVAKHLESHDNLATVSAVFDALHTLSEQSYENKALTFGCILDPKGLAPEVGSEFPGEFLSSKKYKALSDGYRTSYKVSAKGRVLDFLDLERVKADDVTEKHYFPDWAQPIARASRGGRFGIALSRQGDILVFDEGTLRFTYRYGRWQYWNHAHLLTLLRDRARTQKVSRQTVSRVVGSIYRAALDVSFRRSGGLFVILHNRRSLHYVVRSGDGIGDRNRGPIEREFDDVIGRYTIQSLPRVVAVELASLDGAIVVSNSGRILAYGAVLQPKTSGRLRGTEGSRTKAAVGASNYGVSLKISSDGDLTVYHRGEEFIQM
jgi:hypothetical protein